jgi:hypothetical protein
LEHCNAESGGKWWWFPTASQSECIYSPAKNKTKRDSGTCLGTKASKTKPKNTHAYTNNKQKPCKIETSDRGFVLACVCVCVHACMMKMPMHVGRTQG